MTPTDTNEYAKKRDAIRAGLEELCDSAVPVLVDSHDSDENNNLRSIAILIEHVAVLPASEDDCFERQEAFIADFEKARRFFAYLAGGNLELSKSKQEKSLLCWLQDYGLLKSKNRSLRLSLMDRISQFIDFIDSNESVV